MLKTATLVAAFLAHLPLLAEGFNTCTIPQSAIRVRAGQERPVSRAFDNVCVAVLPPTCRNFVVDRKPCAYRACLVPDSLRSCPDGSPVAFTALTIVPYHARTVRPFTAAERDAMNHAIDAEARRLAAKWTDNGSIPLSPGALTVLQNISCQMFASGNPDVRCVPR